MDRKIPTRLHAETLEIGQIALRPMSLLLKFFTLNLIGALATLVICPQYGYGPLAFSSFFMNVIMSYGPVVCGIFCASIFFMGGHFLTYIFLKSSERKWIVRHGYAMTIPYISFLFMLGMGLKSVAPGHLHHDVFSYHTSWVLTALALSMLYLKVLGYRRSFS